MVLITRIIFELAGQVLLKILLVVIMVIYGRRELVWPELDNLLRDDDDPTTVSTPYTAAISEYRVVFYDNADASMGEKSWGNANGHAVYDAQHPCRYEISTLLLFKVWFVQHSPLNCSKLHLICSEGLM